jgi:hypothetical protein
MRFIPFCRRCNWSFRYALECELIAVGRAAYEKAYAVEEE